MKMLALVSLFGLAMAVGPRSAGAAEPELKPGDPAPSWALPGSDGRYYRLEDYRGKEAVVLAWFPKAFTSG